MGKGNDAQDEQGSNASAETGGRKQAREQARLRILTAAREVFSEKGYAGASMAGIAERAGFAKGLLHHYFGGKRELWREVIDDYARDGAQREAATGDGRPEIDSILERMRGRFRFFQRNGDYLRIASWAELEAGYGLPESMADLMHQHTEQLRDAQERGFVRDDLDPLHVHAMTYYLMTGWFQTKRFFCPAWNRDHEKPAVDEAYLDDMLEFVRGGLAAVAARRAAKQEASDGSD